MNISSFGLAGLVCSGTLLLGAVTAAVAHEYQIGAIAILHPYARPTAPGQPTGGGYLTLVNKGAGDRLLSASTPAATSVQLHSMRMDGDVMRMREVAAVDLPANQKVELKPGGLHLMLVGLKAPLQVGQSLPLKLAFEKAGEVSVQLHVENSPLAGAGRASVPAGQSMSHEGHAMPPNGRGRKPADAP